MSILVTGAAGLVGQALLRVAAERGRDLVATDLRRPSGMPAGAAFHPLDVTGPDADRVIGQVKPRTVVHLASIVTPPKGSTRAMQYKVDVAGTRNVLRACLAHGVRRLVVTSSGAAYGYHPDNPDWLTEDAPLRGNEAFAYAHHKRLVEELLAEARHKHPRLEQVVLRVGTVLEPGAKNQITALFERPRLLAIRGSASPFVFVWTEDLAEILLRAATNGPTGIYNVAGDGALSVEDLAARMGKKVQRIPAWALKTALAVAHPLGLSPYGPEQVRFLQYRPVLANDRLKSVFGYAPRRSSAEVFDAWWEAAK
ncbi:NAD-dependent epimerase/dehydratase family protein [Aquicoccus sp. SCR17]|nr:NAD-dependent epimerase/dehydratase family protein [Carideicomes alvinocaridis]